MAANLSVMSHYFVKWRERSISRLWANLICPLAGFVICCSIWLISPLDMRLGVRWTVAGISYVAVQTGGLRRELSA